jgi:hypothetical protein
MSLGGRGMEGQPWSPLNICDRCNVFNPFQRPVTMEIIPSIPRRALLDLCSCIETLDYIAKESIKQRKFDPAVWDFGAEEISAHLERCIKATPANTSFGSCLKVLSDFWRNADGKVSLADWRNFVARAKQLHEAVNALPSNPLLDALLSPPSKSDELSKAIGELCRVNMTPRGLPGSKPKNETLVRFAFECRQKGLTIKEILSKCRKAFPNRTITETSLRSAMYRARKK